MALTDHDTTSGVAEARQQAETLGITLLAGVEINTDSDMGEVHLLGYFAQPDRAELQNALAQLQAKRQERLLQILRALNRVDVPLTLPMVMEQASGSAAVGRLHVARAMVAHNYAGDIRDAFRRYLGWGAAAYVPRYAYTPQHAIETIHRAGGLAVLAHPKRSGNVEQLAKLVEMGLDGIEASYFDHTPDDSARFRRLAEAHGLLCTGGSDFHELRADGHRLLGSVWVTPEDGDKLLERLRATAEADRAKAFQAPTGH